MLPLINRVVPIIFVLFYACDVPTRGRTSAPATKEKSNLNGSWRINEIHWHTKDTTYSIDNAQPGFVVFTDEAYALMWTRTKDARTPFVDLSNPTSEEMIAGFKSVVFNSGTFITKKDTLITKAAIAKVPGFEGGTQYYTYKRDGAQLYLRMYDEIYPNGDHPEWAGIFELAFKLERFAD